MSTFKLWVQKGDQTLTKHAASPDQALAEFSAELGVKLSFFGPDSVSNYMLQGPLPDGVQWETPPDIPVYVVE